MSAFVINECNLLQIVRFHCLVILNDRLGRLGEDRVELSRQFDDIFFAIAVVRMFVSVSMAGIDSHYRPPTTVNQGKILDNEMKDLPAILPEKETYLICLRETSEVLFLFH